MTVNYRLGPWGELSLDSGRVSGNQGLRDQVCHYLCTLEHKNCDILAAKRLQLMRFDNRLIIESFQKAKYTQMVILVVLITFSNTVLGST